MTPRRLSVWVLGVLAVAGIWGLLAPPALGGRTSYVVTSGISMEPRFHTGDLALVRKQSSYAVGDIVAYRSPTLGEVVLHRLHSGDGTQGFRTKGDNNSWLDPDTVRSDVILGRLWLHVPRVGAFAHAKTMVPLAVVLAAGSVAAPVRSRLARRGRHSRRRDGPVGGTTKRSVASVLLVTATVLGVTGAGLLVLAMLATAPAPAPAPVVTHTLALTYRAPADAAVYQGGTLVTGDPVFLKLNPWVDVALQDKVAGAPTGTPRTPALQVRLLGAGGWQYTVPLEGQVSGHGADSGLQARLDLRSLQDVITRAAARTGSPAGSYQLQLLPSVHTVGPGAASAVPVTFKPVVFQFGGGQLALVGGGTRGAPVSQSATEPGRVSASTAAPGKRVHVAGLSLSAGAVTTSGLAALVLAAALGAVGLLRLRRDPLARLPQRPINVAARDLQSRTVMTASVDDLFELARRYDRPVLEMVVAGRRTYAVEEGGTWYGCYLGRSPGATADADIGDMSRDGNDPFEDVPPTPSPRRPPESEPSQG